MTADKSRIEKVIDQLNVHNAKKIALILVLGFVCFHGILHIYYGTNSCKWLLTKGRYKGDQEWQPYGCMLHHYSKTDTRKCLRYIAFLGRHSHFVFIGDTRIQALYTSFVEHLQKDDVATELPYTPKNSTHIDEALKLEIDFFYTPFVSTFMIDMLRHWQYEKQPPCIIIAGAAVDAIRLSNYSAATLEEYKTNLTRIVPAIERLRDKQSKVLWVLEGPVNDAKLTPEYQNVNNEQISLYNKAAVDILYHSSAELWRSVHLIGEGMMRESDDGVHLTPKAMQHNIQILLNMYCNDYMNFNDGTCCSSSEPCTTLQIVTFAILSICIAVAMVMLVHRFFRPVHEYSRLPDTTTPSIAPATNSPPGYYTLFMALAKISLIMVYFFLCDRTNFFMKENKYYSEFSFWVPVGYVTILGLFFTEDSKYTRVLHPDQLSEWKGWMQLVILVYHWTGANQILPINMHIKVLISSYLFLLGYEEFLAVWKRGDIGIVTLFRKLFKINFMTVILCLCMNRPYQFYYFVPLLSFWYLMAYLFFALPPHITAQSSENNVMQYFYLLLKAIVLFTVITILFMSEVFFEKIFVTRPWKALFVTTDDDIRDWWTRWKLDRYSILYGMTFGLILSLAQRYNLYDDNNHNNLFSRGLSLSATLAALSGIGCYLTVTLLCRDELECSEIHSYTVFIPILGYIVLRNISGMLRTRYSSFFAWFGEIYLELFISQYHIWLAADTHGVLVLLPGFPVLNMMITSFIFVCASHEVHRLSKVLLPYAVPQDWKCVLRNFFMFLAVLVPIGINDGMF